MKRVIIYTRVSTQDQTTQNQIEQLRDFAEKSDWLVTEIVEDVASGGKSVSERNGLGEIFKKAHQKQFDILLFWSLDRLSREGSRKTIEYLTRLEDCGVDWHSFTEQYLSSMGPFADCIISLLSTLAKQERIRISERTKAGLQRARKQGTILGRPRTSMERKAKAHRLRDNGLTYREVGEKMNVTAARAYQLVKMQRAYISP